METVKAALYYNGSRLPEREKSVQLLNWTNSKLMRALAQKSFSSRKDSGEHATAALFSLIFGIYLSIKN